MRTIKVDYPRKVEQRVYNGKLFVMEVIRDLDEAIDLICEKLSPDEQMDSFAEDLSPYFGVLWPASEGLAQFLSRHQDLIKGKRMLELGAGLGLPSLVATHLGGRVLTTDFHPDVEEFFQRNCRHSNLKCDYLRLNWREDLSDIGLFDVVMGSDILYESKHPGEVVKGLMRFLVPGGTILLSDPGRAYLQKFVDAMTQEGLQHVLVPISVKDKEVFVFEFKKSVNELGKSVK